MVGGLAAAALLTVGVASCGDDDVTISDPAVTGDPTAGEELFNMGMPEVRLGDSCSTCHTITGTQGPWGPTIKGVYERAGEVEGMTPVEYLRESIVDTEAKPSATWVGSTGNPLSYNMPVNYGEVLTDQEIDDLIAYMYTVG